jgi:hypothetical protein
LTARGLKARTFTHILTAINLFIGRNRTGKTARAEAIKALLYGCDPDRGERKTSVIFGGPQVSIVGAFDTGQEAVQSWTRKPAGGWSRGKDCVLPFETPPTLTNIQHFLTLTASERLTYVLKLANLGLDTKASVALVKNTKVENNTPETEALLDELAEEIRNIAEGVEGTGEGAMGFLERVVKELDTRVSDSGKDVKRLTAAAAGFIQAAERRAENPVRPDIEDIVAERRKTVNELKEKQRAQLRERKASTDRDKQRAKWQETIDATKSAPAEVAELEQKLADKRTEIGRLELELEGLEGKWAEWNRANDEITKATNLVQRHKTHGADVEKWKQNLAIVKAIVKPELTEEEQALNKRLRLDGEWHANERTITQLNADIAKLQSSIAALKPETCPHCQKEHESQAASVLREQLREKQREQRVVADWRSENEPQWARITARINEVSAGEARWRQAQHDLKVLERDISTHEVTPDSLAAAERILAQPAAPQPIAKTELEQRLKTARTERAALMQLHAEKKASETSYREATTCLEVNPALPCPAVDDIVTNEAIEQAEQELATLEADQKRHVANLADARREEETKQDLESARTKQALYKAARDKFTTEREKLVERAFGPLLEKANLFTDGFMPKVEYRDGEIGWQDRGQWVEHSAASGIEEVLVGVGLAIALCQSAPYKAVILGKDEMARFDRENKTKLVQRMISAIGAGQVDQFFGVDTDAEPYKDFAANPEVSVALIEG